MPKEYNVPIHGENAYHQQMLNKHFGENLEISNYENDETREAIKRMQTKLGVPADGNWGPITDQAFHEATDSPLLKFAQKTVGNLVDKVYNSPAGNYLRDWYFNRPKATTIKRNGGKILMDFITG